MEFKFTVNFEKKHFLIVLNLPVISFRLFEIDCDYQKSIF